MAIRYKSRNSKRRYENDWMQDRNSGALEEHPVQAISRTISVKNDGRGKIVYAHADDGGEDIIFESDGDYVVGYGEHDANIHQKRARISLWCVFSF